jgi:FkbM family methyltransferase
MKLALPDDSVLGSMLTDAGLKLVDIGGRGAAFAPLLPLAKFSSYYVSEPDAAEAARLTEQLPLAADWRSVTVLSAAIASRSGNLPLYLTAQPGMSSLLEPDPAVAGRFYLAGKFRVVDVATVPAIGLDAAATEYGFTDAAFLKIDTQGTELDILQSGPRLVGESLVAVHVETLFQPFYKGQSLFADVDAHLRARGFSLFSLQRTAVRRAGFPPALYSKRVMTWAHCLYVREPETLLAGDEATARRQLLRLLAVAIAFEHYDLAFEIIALGDRLAWLPPASSSRLAEEVQNIATIETQRLLRKAEKAHVGEAVLAANVRDKKRIE